jgi:4-hydroxyphenylacetate 3-hydroxylase-like protein
MAEGTLRAAAPVRIPRCEERLDGPDDSRTIRRELKKPEAPSLHEREKGRASLKTEIPAPWLKPNKASGGLVVTMPSLKELKNPEVKDYVKEFYGFGSDEPTENVLKIHKLLQHWTAGQHGVGTWHGAGPVMAQKIMLQRVVNYEHEKSLVKQTLNLKEKEQRDRKD